MATVSVAGVYLGIEVHIGGVVVQVMRQWSGRRSLADRFLMWMASAWSARDVCVQLVLPGMCSSDAATTAVLWCLCVAPSDVHVRVQDGAGRRPFVMFTSRSAAKRHNSCPSRVPWLSAPPMLQYGCCGGCSTWFVSCSQGHLC